MRKGRSSFRPCVSEYFLSFSSLFRFQPLARVIPHRPRAAVREEPWQRGARPGERRARPGAVKRPPAAPAPLAGWPPAGAQARAAERLQQEEPARREEPWQRVVTRLAGDRSPPVEAKAVDQLQGAPKLAEAALAGRKPAARAQVGHRQLGFPARRGWKGWFPALPAKIPGRPSRGFRPSRTLHS